MTARTHDLAAITALGLAVLVVPVHSMTLATALVGMLANQIGGIVPDIDQPTAPFWRNLPIGRIFGKAFDKLLGGHRYISHSLLGLVVFGFLANLLLRFLHPIMPHVSIQLVWYAFLIGVISHLIMDMLTKEGVPLLLPLPFRFGFPPLKALRITTGKHIEMLIVFPLLLILDIWLCANHYNTLLAYIKFHLAL
jgi:inner membrane protein